MKRAMAREAEAEREKRAKIIAAEGEALSAGKLAEAADVISEHPIALQLRNLQVLGEIAVEKNSTIVFPAQFLDSVREIARFVGAERALVRAGTTRGRSTRAARPARRLTTHPVVFRGAWCLDENCRKSLFRPDRCWHRGHVRTRSKHGRACRRKRELMTNTEQSTSGDGAVRVIESVQDAEQSALEAVRDFLDAVNGAFPDVGEDGPRRKIIDSAFKMTEQLVGVSNQLAQRIVKVTEDALGEFDKKASASTK